MIKVAVLGDTGMLGHMVYDYLSLVDNIEVRGFNRSNGAMVGHAVSETWWWTVVGSKFDYIINCIGAIKPIFNSSDSDGIADAVYTNAVYPRRLANHCEKHKNTRLIHISSDCCFTGHSGNYAETSHKDATDLYGMSKALGEPENCMVLRTSIIGPEIHGKKRSLVEWAISNKGKEVNGFINHKWSGITTLELAKSIGKIIKNDWYKNELYHVFGPPITKADLVQQISNAYNLGLIVKRCNAKDYVDRTLSTVKDLNSKLGIPSHEQMIREMAWWTPVWRTK